MARCNFRHMGVQCALEQGHADAEGKPTQHLASMEEARRLRPSLLAPTMRRAPNAAKIVGPAYQPVYGHLPIEAPLPAAHDPRQPRPQGSVHQMVGPLHQPAQTEIVQQAPPVEKPATLEEVLGYDPTKVAAAPAKK